jgi:cell pole-organizing protein PopZ
MDEILASIRQIISEDLASVAADEEGRTAWEDDDDVLILRERAPPEPSPFAPPQHEPHHEQRVHEEHAPHGTPQHSQSQHGLSGPPAIVSPREPNDVAPEAAAEAAASFERLSLVVEETSPPPFAVSSGGATLEDITRELLRPIVKAWLDEHLPGMVRRRVDEEVERIARGRVR